MPAPLAALLPLLGAVGMGALRVGATAGGALARGGSAVGRGASKYVGKSTKKGGGAMDDAISQDHINILGSMSQPDVDYGKVRRPNKSGFEKIKGTHFSQKGTIEVDESMQGKERSKFSKARKMVIDKVTSTAGNSLQKFITSPITDTMNELKSSMTGDPFMGAIGKMLGTSIKLFIMPFTRALFKLLKGPLSALLRVAGNWSNNQVFENIFKSKKEKQKQKADTKEFTARNILADVMRDHEFESDVFKQEEDGDKKTGALADLINRYKDKGLIGKDFAEDTERKNQEGTLNFEDSFDRIFNMAAFGVDDVGDIVKDGKGRLLSSMGDMYALVDGSFKDIADVPKEEAEALVKALQEGKINESVLTTALNSYKTTITKSADDIGFWGEFAAGVIGGKLSKIAVLFNNLVLPALGLGGDDEFDSSGNKKKSGGLLGLIGEGIGRGVGLLSEGSDKFFGKDVKENVDDVDDSMSKLDTSVTDVIKEVVDLSLGLTSLPNIVRYITYKVRYVEDDGTV